MNGVTLYSKNKSGKILEWKAESDLTLNSDGWITLNIYYGQQNGKTQHKVRYTKSGKNKGKVNSTTIEEQALLDLSYLYRAQLEEKGYFLSLDDYKKPRTAMLAHKYQDKKHKLNVDEEDNFVHEYFGQPKLNGIRCTATKVSETEIQFLSRTNKLFTPFEHLSKLLLPILDIGDMVDGELFNPEMPLEYIASLVNSETDRFITDKDLGVTLWKVDDLQYHLYDGVAKDTNDNYKDRKYWLHELFEMFGNEDETTIGRSLIKVLTVPLKSLTHMKTRFSEWITLGYEGLMLRDGLAHYEFDDRSIGLLKYKEMFDEEFQIVDIIESDNEPGQPVFVVDLRNDQTCKVRKSGDKSENEKYLLNRDNYIKKWLTVQYQARTKYDNLSFPVGLLIRDGIFKDGQFIPAS